MPSTKYEYWHNQYVELNGVTLETLEKLVNSNKLTAQEFEKMKNDRKEKYGY